VTDGLAQLRARNALASMGLPTDGLTRASSVHNDVWLTSTHVVRMNRRERSRLAREAALVAHLPRELGHPGVIAHRGELGTDYVISRRLPGAPLSRWWPTMTAAQRRDAIAQLARSLQLLHATAVPPGLELYDGPQLDGRGDPSASILEGLDRARALPHVDHGMLAAVVVQVLEARDALVPYDRSTLVHGDLTFENLLWDGTTLTLLDFEWCRGGPPDLDLDVLLRFCAYPALHVADDYRHQTRAEDYGRVPRWLCEDYPALFTHPRLGARLVLYAIAFDVRDLLGSPPNGGELPRLHPLNRLRRIGDGTSYVTRVAEALASTSTPTPR
jgi:aminoglycoside phosphotransferase (APT) family kinase protein